MGTSLSGLTPKDTYPALLKTSDNTIINSTLKTISDGSGDDTVLQLSTLRVGVKSDSTVTTQTSSVIQSSTTNANLVIAPNGLGALIAQIPDGTVTGGNARGIYSVDLQRIRTVASQVATGEKSVIGGGANNLIDVNSGLSVISGGLGNKIEFGSYGFIGSGNQNFINGGFGFNHVIVGGTANIVSGGNGNAFIGGGDTNTNSAGWGVISGGRSNTASSSYSTVSGGQSNTASTNTHATVVGGASNTASGSKATAGGQGSNASANFSIAIGDTVTASGLGAIALGGQSLSASGTRSGAFGFAVQASGDYSYGFGTYLSAYLRGQFTTSGTNFSDFGLCQQSILVANRQAALASSATTVLSLDGTGVTNLIIPNGNNRLWAVKVVATAFVSVAGGTLVLGDSYMGEYTLLFKKVGGVSSVVGVTSGNIIYDTNMVSAAFTFAAGASQDLQITFKAPTTASATTFRCVARVELTEVAY